MKMRRWREGLRLVRSAGHSPHRWLHHVSDCHRVKRYTLVCVAVTNKAGERISGCSAGWPSSDATGKCPWCGQKAELRDTFDVLPLVRELAP